MKKKLTEEERKARKKAYDKTRLDGRTKEWKEKEKARKRAYGQANKEAIAINKKAYYQANKEAIAISSKAYGQANKEAIAIYRKAYNEANKDKAKTRYQDNRESILIKQKTYEESYRLTHHIVYCLPYYDQHGYMAYAGVTSNPYKRMKRHKQVGNNTEDWFILQICETRKEALKIEAEYHKKGYAGKQGYKNK